MHVPSFFKELDDLETKGLIGVRERILISDRAHVCFDLHVAVDGIVEDASGKKDGGKEKIGTTRKGIGPCYADKVARRGVPFWMLVSLEKNGEGRWEGRLRDLEKGYRRLYGDEALKDYDLEGEVKRFKVVCQVRETRVTSTDLVLLRNIAKLYPTSSSLKHHSSRPRPLQHLLHLWQMGPSQSMVSHLTTY